MTTNKPIKCASTDFTSKPFYLIQYNELEMRFVASFQDKEKIKQFLTMFIEGGTDELHVKICNLEDSQNLKEYEGVVKQSKLKDTLNKYEEVVFHHGLHDLMISCPETGDSVVFDEHGIIFIYTQVDYKNVLEQFGLAYRPNEALIEEVDHWHYTNADERENLKNLINELNLK